jgi:hypothetical protein
MDSNTKPSRLPLGLAIGFVIGLLALAAVRFVTYKDSAVHYHANFTVYVNGDREEFKDPAYYEEISACSSDFDRPQHRAHLHDNINDVVHVHDQAVTWGDLFNNLGWNIGSTFISTPTKLYSDTDSGHLMIMLNGQSVASIANKVIGDKDRLLISYGKMDAKELQTQIDSVAKTAEQVDKTADPATCSGPETSGWRARLNNILH